MGARVGGPSLTAEAVQALTATVRGLAPNAGIASLQELLGVAARVLAEEARGALERVAAHNHAAVEKVSLIMTATVALLMDLSPRDSAAVARDVDELFASPLL